MSDDPSDPPQPQVLDNVALPNRMSSHESDTMGAELHEHIARLGAELVVCGRRCAGILVDQDAGILPRCLISETGRDPDANGCGVIGPNPGQSFEAERRHFVQCGSDYKSFATYWRKATEQGVAYYTKLRKFLDGVGVEGPVLWTELVKCESDPSWDGGIPIQTQRTCATAFLLKELEAIPDHWPLFAVSADPFRALSYLVPSRPVIGLPHPTGSFGHWGGLFSEGSLKPDIVDRIETALRRRHAVWLGKAK